MATKTRAPRFDKPCGTCGEMMHQVLERAYSCAECSSLKNDAYRRNVYPGLMRGFEAAHGEGLTGAAARARALEGIDAFRAERAAYRQREEERTAAEAQARRQRAITNQFLRQHGYHWVKYEIGSEDDWAGRGSLGGGTGEAIGYEWELLAPDGRIVTVAQAQAEIATATTTANA